MLVPTFPLLDDVETCYQSENPKKVGMDAFVKYDEYKSAATEVRKPQIFATTGIAVFCT